jgi:hypothetical protein
MKENDYSREARLKAMVLLKKHNGNVEKTAREMGVNPKTVQRWKMKEEFADDEIQAELARMIPRAEHASPMDARTRAIARNLYLLNTEFDMNKVNRFIEVMDKIITRESAFEEITKHLANNDRFGSTDSDDTIIPNFFN